MLCAPSLPAAELVPFLSVFAVVVYSIVFSIFVACLDGLRLPVVIYFLFFTDVLLPPNAHPEFHMLWTELSLTLCQIHRLQS